MRKSSWLSLTCLYISIEISKHLHIANLQSFALLLTSDKFLHPILHLQVYQQRQWSFNETAALLRLTYFTLKCSQILVDPFEFGLHLPKRPYLQLKVCKSITIYIKLFYNGLYLLTNNFFDRGLNLLIVSNELWIL